MTNNVNVGERRKNRIKNAADSLAISKYVLPLQPQTRNKVPWMSGLVSGLQNRVRRFESARNLQKQERIRMKISNPFVFQQLTSSVVEGLEEEIS